MAVRSAEELIHDLKAKYGQVFGDALEAEPPPPPRPDIHRCDHVHTEVVTELQTIKQPPHDYIGPHPFSGVAIIERRQKRCSRCGAIRP